MPTQRQPSIILRIARLVIFWFLLPACPMHASTIETSSTITINQTTIITMNQPITAPVKDQSHVVHKTVLPNGMTILVLEEHALPKVAIQLWYGVGSRDETDKERGIAHLIEHMIFKGTEKLSESDINVVTHMLSGNCNAFTSYDFTGYLFNLPTQNWREALPIMADCMVNCTFKSDMLNSEMKAVIQELKMYRDHYTRSLVDEMIGVIFSEHPYHHPIIGYKQDLWSVGSDDLKAFYRTHYVPNNATLVVVGDVKTQEVIELAQKYFGSIPADLSYKRPTNYLNKDIAAKSVTLYRDVQQPSLLYAFVVPGTKDKKDYALQSLAWIIGKGKSSRLYTRLVEKEQLATSVDASYVDLFDYGLFFIECEPKNADDAARIKKIIGEIIQEIGQGSFTDQELTKAVKQTRMNLFDTLEDLEQQASEIGKYFLATGDPNFAFTMTDQPLDSLKKDIIAIASAYLRLTVMHEGAVLPLPATELPIWQTVQEESDEEDNRILAARPRNTEVEPPSYALTVKPQSAIPFNFPKATTWTLANGLKVFVYHNAITPKIDVIVDLKVDEAYDPADKFGLCLFMSKMLVEGTKKYNAQEFARELESRGIGLNTDIGALSMSLLREDLPFALDIINQMLMHATFDEQQIEKVRENLLTRIKNFWDDASTVATQLTKEAIYKNHPYARSGLGTVESIKSITKKDLEEFYKKYVSPHGARMAIVGDYDQNCLRPLVEKEVGSWHGPAVAQMTYPKLEQIKETRLSHYLNRDQIALMLARLSVERLNPDFDKLLLFDQILSGGALTSMSSRLFELRERSGLFYTIRGSTVAGAYEQPGLMMIKTIVSLDRLAEAEKAIRDTLRTCVNSLTQEEVEEAKRALEATLINNFASNHAIALAFLFLDRYKLPADFFDNRAANLEKITLKQVQDAANKVINADELVVMTVGRVGQAEKRK